MARVIVPVYPVFASLLAAAAAAVSFWGPGDLENSDTNPNSPVAATCHKIKEREAKFREVILRSMNIVR